MGKSGALNVIGLCGSLRRDSFNMKLLKACDSLAPDAIQMEVFDRLGEFPLYNEDIREQGLPDAVEMLREKVRAADGLLIASPEYNHSISPVTKNMIDWVSRPPDQPFLGKPIAVIGASSGRLGGPWGQYVVRQCFVAIEGLVMTRPEVFIGEAPGKFDEDGNITDELTRDWVTQFMAAFEKWMRRLGE